MIFLILWNALCWDPEGKGVGYQREESTQAVRRASHNRVVTAIRAPVNKCVRPIKAPDRLVHHVKASD